MQNVKVSLRIRAFMVKRQMDIQDLAEASGLTPEFIETMLMEGVYPPLGPLMKIARALGVRLGSFRDDQESSDP